MAPPLSQGAMEQLSKALHADLGLFLSSDRWRDLARQFNGLAKSHGFQDLSLCLRWLLTEIPAPKRLDIMARHFTIGETYFFRDREVFSLLEKQILPDCSRNSADISGGAIRIWSAGCSSGEEPYTMAIVAAEARRKGLASPVQIIASDINEEALEKAKRGVYRDWSFRNPPAGYTTPWFTAVGQNQSQIAAEIRSAVAFQRINLKAAHYPPPLDQMESLDVIFCRNVLMYFDQPQRDAIVRRFVQRLKPNGWLLVAPCEIPFIHHSKLRAEKVAGVSLFRAGPPEGTLSSSVQSLWPLSVAAGKPASLFLPTLPVSPASDSTPVSTQRMAEEGDELNGEEQWHALVAELDGGREVSKQAIEALAGLAKEWVEKGVYPRAEKSYRLLMAADKLNPDHYYRLAMLLLEGEQMLEGEKLLKKVLFLEPDHLLAHVQLAALSRRPQEVQRHVRNALALLAPLSADMELPDADGLNVATVRASLQHMKGGEHV
ncbi:MAG: protein-glutamate O-methyltransferase CheR [Magnetococcales bacterium]|nr:protein-glutamate O-methyltransferase CheR [Magnetococcales bacterium]